MAELFTHHDFLVNIGIDRLVTSWVQVRKRWNVAYPRRRVSSGLSCSVGEAAFMDACRVYIG